jgi:hypothetical protein
MKRAILIALLLVSPAFAATMNTSASQLGGNQFIQLNPGDLPSLTDTFAGTAFQSTYPNALIFVTSLLPTGSFTISFTLTIGGQQFNLSRTPCTMPGVCNVYADFTMPTFYQPTKGTLVVNVSGVSTSFDFMFRSAVPEPTSLILLGTGLGAIAWRRLRRTRPNDITL